MPLSKESQALVPRFPIAVDHLRELSGAKKLELHAMPLGFYEVGLRFYIGRKRVL